MTPTTQNPKLAYRVSEAASLLDISKRSVERLIHEGRLESFKIGNLRRVSHEALTRYVKSLESFERDFI